MVLLAVLSAACAGNAAHGGAQAPSTAPCCSSGVMRRGLEIAARYHVAAIAQRRFTHAQFWAAIAPSLRSPDFTTREVGRSMLGREIRSVTFGHGPTTVLLWSQMHGDEATATMALADIFRFLAEAKGDSLRERLRANLTIVFIPMLNPDGAELFQRENAAGIDINRDARRLATPEARILKLMVDSLHPAFGFNLHDQNARTRVGEMGVQSGIALEAPAYDESRSYNASRSRARLVAATLAELFQTEIPGRVAKYDDTFNPRAFGDLIEQWGSSTVLIESGALPNDPDKQRLRTLNVAAILGALDAIGTESYRQARQASYDDLPYNTGGAADVLILGGQLAIPGQPPMPADISINYADAVARTDGRVRDVGDLREAIAIDTIDASGLFIHPSAAALSTSGGRSWLRIGAHAVFDLRRGADAGSELVWRVPAD